jgi:hypothetical protein
MEIYNLCIELGLSKVEANEYMINTFIILDGIRKCWLIGDGHGYNVDIINAILKLDICKNLSIISNQYWRGVDYFICLCKNEKYVRLELKSGKNMDIIYGQLLGFPCPRDLNRNILAVQQVHGYNILYDNTLRQIYGYSCQLSNYNTYKDFIYAITIFKKICNIIYKYKIQLDNQYLTYSCFLQINKKFKHTIQIIWDFSKSKADNIKNIKRAILKIKEIDIDNIYAKYIKSDKNIKMFKDLTGPINITISIFKNDKNNISFYP